MKEFLIISISIHTAFCLNSILDTASGITPEIIEQTPLGYGLQEYYSQCVDSFKSVDNPKECGDAIADMEQQIINIMVFWNLLFKL